MCTINDLAGKTLRQGYKRKQYVYLDREFVAKFATASIAEGFVSMMNAKNTSERSTIESLNRSPAANDMVLANTADLPDVGETEEETKVRIRREKDAARKRASRAKAKAERLAAQS